MNIAIDYDRDYSGRFTIVEIGNAQLFFSYKTLIGLWVPGKPAIVSENIWSNTTGKHLGMIRQRHDTVTVANSVLHELAGKLFTLDMNDIEDALDAIIGA